MYVYTYIYIYYRCNLLLFDKEGEASVTPNIVPF